jgi:hypothetical protein
MTLKRHQRRRRGERSTTSCMPSVYTEFGAMPRAGATSAASQRTSGTPGAISGHIRPALPGLVPRPLCQCPPVQVRHLAHIAPGEYSGQTWSTGSGVGWITSWSLGSRGIDGTLVRVEPRLAIVYALNSIPSALAASRDASAMILGYASSHITSRFVVSGGELLLVANGPPGVAFQALMVGERAPTVRTFLHWRAREANPTAERTVVRNRPGNTGLSLLEPRRGCASPWPPGHLAGARQYGRRNDRLRRRSLTQVPA